MAPSYPQFCQIKKPKQVLQRAGESHKISSQRIEKYLPGEKRENKSQEIEYEIDPCIQQWFFDPRFLLRHII